MSAPDKADIGDRLKLTGFDQNQCRRDRGIVAWLRVVPKPNNHTSPQLEAKIEISLNRLSQLFNSFDPSPFHERDLDQNAEDYIVSSAEEISRHCPPRLVIH